MPENVTISYRGSSYEIGRAPAYYGIWRVGAPRSEPLEWWPETTEGWYSAWSRFTALEVPDTIAPVAEAPVTEAPVVEAAVPRRAIFAAALIGLGVVCGVVGLFPDYLGGASLAGEPVELLPHAIYLAAWSASALLIALGGGRWKLGALLGLGTSVVTFGFFFADAGSVIADGAHVLGSGLVLGLVGWLACAVGSAISSMSSRRAGRVENRRRLDLFPLVAMTLCAIGVAAAFAPSWDSYTLQTTTGSAQSITAGNIFANPAPIIAGNVAVMIGLVAVVVAAALWRPVLQGTVLLAGAVLPMAAQVVSALIQVGQGATPAMFGISSATATSEGLTITSGLTLAFWIYCIFVVLLVVAGLSALGAPSLVEEPSANWAINIGVGPQSSFPPGSGWQQHSGAAPGSDQAPGPAPGSGGDPATS